MVGGGGKGEGKESGRGKLWERGELVPTRTIYSRPTEIGRFPSGDLRGVTQSVVKILNMFNTESRPTLRNVGRQLWRVGRLLHTHMWIRARIGRLGARVGRF